MIVLLQVEGRSETKKRTHMKCRPKKRGSDDSPPTTSLFVNPRNTDGGTLDTP